MQNPHEAIFLGVVIAGLSSLVTLAIRVVFENKTLEGMKQRFQEELHIRLKEHAEDCPANMELQEIKKEIQVVRTALTFLVSKSDGNLKELGLA